MKKLFTLLIFLICIGTLYAQPVSYYVQGDGDDWQLYMSSKVMSDLKDGGKVVFITLTAGDEGNGITAFNGSSLSYYLAREKEGVYSAKFANDVTEGSGTPVVLPLLQTISVNGHNLARYVYKNTVSYFLRLPDGNIGGTGFPGTGNVSLKKLKDGIIGSITSVDGANTYTGWASLTITINAIINAEKGSNSEVWLNTGNLDATVNPNDHSDHIYSSTAAQDAVNNQLWVGINEFINDYSLNLAPNLTNGAFQDASGIFATGILALIENKYTTVFSATNKLLLPMDYYSVKRSPSACASPSGLSAAPITNTGATLSWAAATGAINYDVDYKINTSSIWINAVTATTNLSVNLSGLTQGTLYDWRVRTNCSNGNGAYVTAQFSTTTPASCNTPTGLASSAITFNSATIGWSAVNGAASYTVEYKLASSPAWQTAAVATTALTANLAGLAATSQYDWRVRANCTLVGLTSSYAQSQFTTIVPPIQAVSYYVQGDGDDWQLYMASKVMSDLKDGGKTVFITLTAGDEGNGNTAFNGSSMPYYLAREREGVLGAKSSTDITEGSGVPNVIPVVQMITLNGHNLARYVYKNTVSYFLRLPEGNIGGTGFPATGNVSLKKLKDGTISSITAVDGSSTYSGWASLTGTIAAIINTEKGSNTQAWLNTGNLDAVVNPGDYSDHIYSSTAAQDAVSNFVWVGINEFINDHSANLAPNLSNSAFEDAAAIFGTSVIALTDNKYPTDFNASSKSLLPMDYYTVKRSPSTCTALPTGLTSSSVTNTGAILNWTAAPGAINYDVDYKVAASSVWVNAATATTNLSVNLSGLIQGILYDWRVRANCSSGNGAYVSAQFTTTMPPSCNAPTGLVSSAITVNSATLSWSVVSGAASYTVEYKLASASTYTTAAAATAALTINLAGLASGSQYDWRVRANCTGVGLTSPYTQAQFTTIAPCNAPTGLVSSAITTNSATVSWSAVSGAANYTVEYKLVSASTYITAASATTALTINLTGLAAGSQYTWRVRSNCTGTGLTSTYAQLQFATVASCSAPTGLTNSGITMNSATISWTAVSGALSYTLEGKLASSSTWIVVASAMTGTTLTGTGLPPSTTYDWRVRANCPSGLTSPYSQSQFTTLTPTCDAPTDLTSSNITLNSATLSWDAVSGAANYRVEYKLGSSSTWNVITYSTNAVSVNLTGLANSTLYNWRVRANCSGVGLTSIYAQSQFTTVTPTCNAPANLVSANITTNSATVSWDAVSGAGNYRVEYKLASASTWITLTSATTAVSVNITGLTQSSSYQWRVRTNCTNGLTSAYTQSQFTTLVPTCNAPAGLASSSITMNSATVSWTAVTGAASYAVEYKLSSSSTWIIATSSTTATNRSLTGLAYSSLYNWRVKVNCTNGLTSAYTQSQFTTTAPTCNTPTGLATTNLTSTSATVNWAAVTGAANYRVEYKLASSSTWITLATATTALSINITGLANSSLYQWQVRANCTGYGLTSAYAQSQFTTPCPDLLEPNETYSSAQTIPVENDNKAQIATSGDDDYYKFNNSNSLPNIKVTLSNLPADYDMKLYHPFGILLDASEQRGNVNETVIYNPNSLFLNVGTYRVYVYGYNNAFSSSQCYTIRIDLSATDFNSFSNSGTNTTPAPGEGVQTTVNDSASSIGKEPQTVRTREIKVYPVPASSVVNVSFDAFAKGSATIIISNQLGQEVIRKTVGVDNGINITSVDVSNLKPGVYSLRVNNGNNVQAKKLIVTR